MLDVHGILRQFCGGGFIYEVLVTHSEVVYKKAEAFLSASGKQLSESERIFLWEGCMLHDIGIVGVNSPKLGCTGEAPYIQHGVIGAEMLRGLGLDKHALICERHIGVGIGPEDIVSGSLDLPMGDYRPQSYIEKLVCFSDLFFSKRVGFLDREESWLDICSEVSRYGEGQLERLDVLRQDVGVDISVLMC